MEGSGEDHLCVFHVIQEGFRAIFLYQTNLVLPAAAKSPFFGFKEVYRHTGFLGYLVEEGCYLL